MPVYTRCCFGLEGNCAFKSQDIENGPPADIMNQHIHTKSKHYQNEVLWTCELFKKKKQKTKEALMKTSQTKRKKKMFTRKENKISLYIVMYESRAFNSQRFLMITFVMSKHHQID